MDGVTVIQGTSMTPDISAAQVYEYLKNIAPSDSLKGALPLSSVRKYIGALDDNRMFHGEGILLSAMGFRYEGSFVHGVMEGNGRISWSSGIMYEGNFKDNAPNGTGIFTWVNGDKYVGQVEHGVRHGNGELRTISGIYTGAWVHGKRQGVGRQTYLGNSFYEGEWKDNKRHGKGKLIYPNGDVYDGMWCNGERHGFGVMGWKYNKTYYNEIYEGEWSLGIPHGSGRSTYIHYLQNEDAPYDMDTPANFAPPAYAVVNVYEGNYVKGKRNGFGIFFYADGSTYEGEWRNGKKEGYGKCTTGVGASHYGRFHDNEVEELLKGTTSSNPLPTINLLDLLGISENSLEEASASIRLLLLKFNNILKDLFTIYSGKNENVAFITTPLNWWRHRTPGHIGIPQFLRLLNDAHIINGKINIGNVIDCVVTTIRKEDEENIENEIPEEPWSRRLKELSLNVLKLEGYINYRQFVESLIRISAIACIGPSVSELSRRFTTLIEGPLAKHYLTDEPLCPLSRELKDLLIPHIPVLETLFYQIIKGSEFKNSNTCAILSVREFIILFRSIFDSYGINLTEALNYLFPFDRFKTPGVVPTAVCQPRNALGFSLYEKSCGTHQEFTATLVASERRITFIEFLEAILGAAHLTGAVGNEDLQQRIIEIIEKQRLSTQDS